MQQEKFNQLPSDIQERVVDNICHNYRKIEEGEAQSYLSSVNPVIRFQLGEAMTDLGQAPFYLANCNDISRRIVAKKQA